MFLKTHCIRSNKTLSKTLLIMRLTAILILISCLQVSAKGYAQKVTLSMRDAPLQKVFKEIQRQTGYHFLYTYELLEKAGKVDVKVQNAPLQDALYQCLENTPLTYSIVENTVVIKKKEVMNVQATFLTEEIPLVENISGKVTDEAGNPLQGVSVLIKGSTIGTNTDANGMFNIDIPDNSSQVLVFSFVGMETQEVNVKGKRSIQITMKSVSSGLSDVVVVGYGTRKKSSVTSSISKIENVQLDQVPNADIGNTLAGRVAGLSIANNRNTPGTAPVIRVRGLGSISAGNDPLVVIDGFPGGDLSQLSMNDIASIEVLKDASSTAIYGSRGAGGVVMVTTKRGKSGKSELKLNSYYGFQKGILHDDWLTGQEWYDYLTKYENREFVWDGGDPSIPVWGDPRRPGKYQLNPLAMTLPQTIWQDEITRTAPIQNHNLSISGGNDKVKYYVSGTYTDEDGIIKTAWYKNYSLRANLDVKINKVISMGFELSPSYSKTRVAGSNMVSLVKYPPFVSPIRANGQYPRTFTYIPSVFSGQASPYTFLYGTENFQNSFANVGHGFINFKIADGLSLNSSVGADFVYNTNNNWSGGIGDPGVNTNGSLGQSQSMNLVNENVLSYTKTLNKVHELSGILGASYQHSISESSSMAAVANSFNNDIIKTLNNAIINPAASTQSKSEWGLESYFARINYSYKNKYLVEGSMRTDGSSRFGPNNKWGYFPSASVAWRVTNEDFMKNISKISELKLRASYGVTGNFNIGDFQYLGAVSTVRYSPGNQTVNAVAQTSFGNDDLSWEKTKGYDLGLDLGLFNSRLYLTFDYYDNQTTSMLYALNVPAITGFTSTVTNSGGVRNRGVDLEITSRNIVGNFKWNTSFNISHNKNEVTDLGGVDERVGTYWSMDFVLRKGLPMFSYSGYKISGIYQTAEEIANSPHLAGAVPGNPIIKDRNGDGNINTQDKQILGNFQPKVLMGLSNDFSWKNFDLNIFINASLGAKMFNAEDQYYEGNTNGAMRKSLVENQWWSVDEPGDGKTPALALRQLFGFNTNTDYYIEDASYMYVRNVILGYKFENIAKKKWGIQSLRIYTSMNNLIVVKSKDNHSYNPEGSTLGEVSGINSYPGVNLGSEPLNRTIVFGINLGF
jgi:TonB-linked SusC/RagA family outer membrane protein